MMKTAKSLRIILRYSLRLSGKISLRSLSTKKKVVIKNKDRIVSNVAVSFLYLLKKYIISLVSLTIPSVANQSYLNPCTLKPQRVRERMPMEVTNM
jgi:hypothetical protein